MVGRVQFLLIAFAMAMLSHLNMTVNSYVLSTSDVSVGNEAILGATSIAQSMLREVAAKSFDEKTIGRMIASPDSLTPVALLGKESGEVSTAFDDIDDYNGYTRTVSTDRLGSFTVTDSVCYTSRNSPGAKSATRTFVKLITVTVSGNPYLRRSVAMTTIVSY